MQRGLILTILLLWVGNAWAYHEFQESKEAYKVETIQYYSNPGAKTEPDSTVTIYYDGSVDTTWFSDRKTHKWTSEVHWRYWEIYRKVVKGCSNVINWDSIDWGTIKTLNLEDVISDSCKAW